MPPEDQDLNFSALGIDVPEAPLGATVTVEAPTVEKASNGAEKEPQVTFEDLKRELSATKAAMAQERREKEEAQNAARQLQSVAGRADVDARTSAIASIDNAIAAREARRTSILRDRSAAMQAGDWDKEGELSSQLADLAAELNTLKVGKHQAQQQFEAQKQNLARQQQTAQNQQGATPVEQFLARTNIRGQSADWIRRNPGVIDRPNKLGAADLNALDEGCDRDTPEYFASVERFLGIGARDDRAREPAHPKSEPRSDRAAGAAPPSRHSTPVSGDRADTGGAIKLTAEHRRAARISGVTDEEYATNYAALRRSGAINN